MDCPGKVLIYYEYVSIEKPQELCAAQKKLCNALHLTGRVLIAHEGINATLGGSHHAIQKYIDVMLKNPLFAATDFKISDGGPQAFPRLRVAVRDQIVNWGPRIEDADPAQAGLHLDPQQTHEILQQNPDNLVVFDVRNQYESRIGCFEGALKAPIEHFRQLPDYIDENLNNFKDKIVIMNCTSGVRCERASAYLNAQGVAQQVYQMRGGIQRYTQEYPRGFFKGKNYVFDARGALEVTQDILSTCDLCPVAYNTYSNCINAECNEQFIACPACKQAYKEACSDRCKQLVETNSVVLRAPGGVRRSQIKSTAQSSKNTTSFCSVREV